MGEGEEFTKMKGISHCLTSSSLGKQQRCIILNYGYQTHGTLSPEKSQLLKLVSAENAINHCMSCEDKHGQAPQETPLSITQNLGTTACRTSHPHISCHLLIYAHFLESRGLGPNHTDISSCVSLRASLSIFLDTPFSSGPSLLPSQQHHPSAPEPAPYAPVNLSHQAALHLAAIQASARSLGTMHGCVLAHLAFGNAS